MFSVALHSGLGKLLRWGRALLKFPAWTRRPAALALLFWCNLLLMGTIYMFLFDGVKRWSALALAALVAVWMVMPWDPRASWRVKLAAPAFVAAAAALNLAGGGLLFYLFYLLYLLAISNGVFLFGLWRGAVYAAGVLAILCSNFYWVSYRASWAPQQQQEGFMGLVDVLIIFLFWGVVAALIVGVSVAAVDARRRREETENLHAELEESHTELESAHAELERYAERVRELAVAEERARIAGEMHDTVGHYLTVINVGLENARRFKDKKPDSAWGEVEEAKGLTQEALSEVRRRVRALKPLSLEEKAGPEAMDALARSFDGTGLDVHFTVEGVEAELPEEAELALYRVLEEGLTNAVRHSGARRVEATLTFENSSARLVVADDGEGAPEEVCDGTPESGFGLSALKERVRAAGGRMSAGNGPGGGFLLEASLSTTLPAAPETEKQ